MTRAAVATTQAARLSSVAEAAVILFIVHAPRICRSAPGRKTTAGLQIEPRSCLAPPLSSSRHAYPRCAVLIASSRGLHLECMTAIHGRRGDGDCLVGPPGRRSEQVADHLAPRARTQQILRHLEPLMESDPDRVVRDERRRQPVAA